MSARHILARASAVVDALEHPEAGDVEVVESLRAVGELRRLVDAAGITLAARLSTPTGSGAAAELDRRFGERSPAALVASTVGIEPAEAAAWCAVGEAVASRVTLTGEVLPPVRPAVAAAVAVGTVSVTAAHRIVRALDDAGAAGGAAEQLHAFEQTLVASAPVVAPRDLKRLCRRIIDLVDPDGAEPREDLLRARSSVTVTQQDDGLTRLVALLHPEAAGFVLSALDARTAPRRQPRFADTEAALTETADRRPLAQRRVDALVGIARSALAADPGQLSGAPVTVLVTMPLDALTMGVGTARLASIDEPVSAGTARRLAADAGLIPVVLGSGSEILDQGRETRLATSAQRRALALRDGGCAWTDCDAPPGWCEVAHIRAWADGGPTDLDNLLLLCPVHHRCLDHDGWHIGGRDGIRWLIPPPHVDPTRAPRPLRSGRSAA